jgi:periplasmic divalent cation tolerance protein
MAKSSSKKRAPRAGDIRVVVVTAPPAEAEGLARKLLEEHLVACANLVPGVTSLYWWEGKIQRDGEILIVMKTPRANVAKLMRRVKELHSYKVPEFLTLSVHEGNPDYVKWVNEESY